MPEHRPPGGSRIFAGLDIGSSAVKVVLLDGDGSFAGHAVRVLGSDLRHAAAAALDDAAGEAGLKRPSFDGLVATGFGRSAWTEASAAKTEISCHAKGSYHDVRRPHTLIDIGGQDCKIIRIDGQGRRMGFRMNRKCAAGTGAFLEEAALRLRVGLETFDDLARSSTRDVEIGSYCTVFAAAEILHLIRRGVEMPDIVKGLFGSIVQRTMEMDLLEGDVVLTGGVAAHHPFLIRMFETRLGRPVIVPPRAQFTGALGAAIFALEAWSGRHA
ncbi:MAG: acyl-CoA dehydratase activase [Candidatus Aminicenantes bacterium]|nr:acyl-CoA dehydratase activase [Candidatus Aminicenantes bacterium]